MIGPEKVTVFTRDIAKQAARVDVMNAQSLSGYFFGSTATNASMPVTLSGFGCLPGPKGTIGSFLASLRALNRDFFSECKSFWTIPKLAETGFHFGSYARRALLASIHLAIALFLGLSGSQI